MKLDTSNWSEEGQSQVRRHKRFVVFAWIFLAANAIAMLAYLNMFISIDSPNDAFFLNYCNKAWWLPALATIPAAVFGFRWIAKSFQIMGDTSEDAYSSETIALGFVFPGLWFVRPQRIMKALYHKSCQFAEVASDPKTSGIINLWVIIFWVARLMDVGKFFAFRRMESIMPWMEISQRGIEFHSEARVEAFTPVALFAIAACALNIVFILRTLNLFKEIFQKQSIILKDPVKYEQQYQKTVIDSIESSDQLASEFPIKSLAVQGISGKESTNKGADEIGLEKPRFVGHGGGMEALCQAPADSSTRSLSWIDILLVPEGRLSRGTFLKYALWVFVANLLVVSAAALLGKVLYPLLGALVILFGIGALLMTFPISYVFVILQIKRWRDLGRSGWMVLTNWIPVVGIGVFVWYMCICKGDEGSNDYGCVERDGVEYLDERKQSELAFWEKLKSGSGGFVIKKLKWTDILFSIQGRLSRGTYFKYLCLLWGCQFLVTSIAVGMFLFGFLSPWLVSGALLIHGIIGVLATILQIKRWHDHNRSGWMVFVVLVPVFGLVYAFIKLLLLKGDLQRNDFGNIEWMEKLHLGADAIEDLDFVASL